MQETMQEPQPYNQLEVMAVDVQPGDHLVDRLSDKPFLWPNGEHCSGLMGPFHIVESRTRGRLVELVDDGGAVHLHNVQQILLVYRPVD